jgi:hypothetical protein
MFDDKFYTEDRTKFIIEQNMQAYAIPSNRVGYPDKDFLIHGHYSALCLIHALKLE